MKMLFIAAICPCLIIACATAAEPAKPQASALVQAAPAFLADHHTAKEDTQAIEELLNTYANAVSTGNRQAFLDILLNKDVPFMGVQKTLRSNSRQSIIDTRSFESFDKAVFLSGAKYEQKFYDVHIEQDGSLAQVSLDFVTKVAGSQKGSYGWKTLQLLKVDGKWKIVSEFYTGYALPQ